MFEVRLDNVAINDVLPLKAARRDAIVSVIFVLVYFFVLVFVFVLPIIFSF